MHGIFFIITDCDMDETCIICKESTHGIVAVGDKGRSTLVSSSLERRDGLHEISEKATTLKESMLSVGNNTSEKVPYYLPKEGLCVMRKMKCPCSDQNLQKTVDLKTDCLFCSVSQVSKIPLSRRRPVSNAETLEFPATVVHKAQDRNDKWGSDVAHRLKQVHDLAAAEAKYHWHCATSFFRTTKTEKMPDVNFRQEAFNKLCEFFDDHDECQYSLQELSYQMAEDVHGHEGYSLKHLKTKFKEHYGDDIVVTSTGGHSSVVSFRNSAHKVLHDKWITDKVSDARKQSDRIIAVAASIIQNDIRMTMYNCHEYTTLETTNNGETLIPSSLK